MRVGITVSTLGHLAILGFGFIAFPDAEPFQAEKIEALPVDLVTIAEFTDLAEGNKRAEVAPEESPQPKPQVQAEVPAPQPAEKPAEQPVHDISPGIACVCERQHSGARSPRVGGFAGREEGREE